MSQQKFYDRVIDLNEAKLNTQDNLTKGSQNRLIVAQNVSYKKKGTLSKREGFKINDENAIGKIKQEEYFDLITIGLFDFVLDNYDGYIQDDNVLSIGGYKRSVTTSAIRDLANNKNTTVDPLGVVSFTFSDSYKTQLKSKGTALDETMKKDIGNSYFIYNDALKGGIFTKNILHLIFSEKIIENFKIFLKDDIKITYKELNMVINYILLGKERFNSNILKTNILTEQRKNFELLMNKLGDLDIWRDKLIKDTIDLFLNKTQENFNFVKNNIKVIKKQHNIISLENRYGKPINVLSVFNLLNISQRKIVLDNFMKNDFTTNRKNVYELFEAKINERELNENVELQIIDEMFDEHSTNIESRESTFTAITNFLLIELWKRDELENDVKFFSDDLFSMLLDRHELFGNKNNQSLLLSENIFYNIVNKQQDTFNNLFNNSNTLLASYYVLADQDFYKKTTSLSISAFTHFNFEKLYNIPTSFNHLDFPILKFINLNNFDHNLFNDSSITNTELIYDFNGTNQLMIHFNKQTKNIKIKDIVQWVKINFTSFLQQDNILNKFVFIPDGTTISSVQTNKLFNLFDKNDANFLIKESPKNIIEATMKSIGINESFPSFSVPAVTTVPVYDYSKGTVKLLNVLAFEGGTTNFNNKKNLQFYKNLDISSITELSELKSKLEFIDINHETILNVFSNFNQNIGNNFEFIDYDGTFSSFISNKNYPAQYSYVVDWNQKWSYASDELLNLLTSISGQVSLKQTFIKYNFDIESVFFLAGFVKQLPLVKMLWKIKFDNDLKYQNFIQDKKIIFGNYVIQFHIENDGGSFDSDNNVVWIEQITRNDVPVSKEEFFFINTNLSILGVYFGYDFLLNNFTEIWTSTTDLTGLNIDIKYNLLHPEHIQNISLANSATKIIGYDTDGNTHALPTDGTDIANFRNFKISYFVASFSSFDDINNFNNHAFVKQTNGETVNFDHSKFTTNNDEPIWNKIKLSIWKNSLFIEESENKITNFKNLINTSFNLENVYKIDWVEYLGKIFITTGTQVYVLQLFHDNTKQLALSINKLQDLTYIPSPEEFLVFGPNTLNADIYNDVKPNIGIGLAIDFVRFNPYISSIGQVVEVNAIVDKQTELDNIVYEWTVMTPTDNTDFVPIANSKDLSLIGTSNTNKLKVKPSQNGLYVFKIKATFNGQTVTAIAEYNVGLGNKKISKIKSLIDDINKCEKVMIHRDKILFYGNGTSYFYASLPNNPFYFPFLNVVNVVNNKREELNSLVLLKNILLGFTENTISAIVGNGNPSTLTQNDDFYNVVSLESTVGSVSKWGATNFENTVFFISHNGAYIVEQVDVSERRAKLVKIDNDVENIIPKDKNVIVGAVDKRIHISNGINNKMLVFDYEFDKWSIWNSPELNVKWYRLVNDVLYIGNSDKILYKNKIIDNKQEFYFLDGQNNYEFLIQTKRDVLTISYQTDFKYVFIDGETKYKKANQIHVKWDTFSNLNIGPIVWLLNETNIINQSYNYDDRIKDTKLWLGDIVLSENVLGTNNVNKEYIYTIIKENYSKWYSIIVSHKQNSSFELSYLKLQFKYGPKSRKKFGGL